MLLCDVICCDRGLLLLILLFADALPCWVVVVICVLYDVHV